MQTFNQALLGRQAWCLVDNPASLCARVLKAKYYPNGSLVDTVFFLEMHPLPGKRLNLGLNWSRMAWMGRMSAFGEIHGFQEITEDDRYHLGEIVVLNGFLNF